MPIPPSEWVRAEVVWLVTLRWRGEIFRFASQVVDLLDDNGDDVKLNECPPPLDVLESIGELTTQAKGSSATIQVYLDGIDLLAERMKGHRLDGASAEIAYVTARAGSALQTWERREVLVDALLQEPRYGDPDMPAGLIEATVEQTNTVDYGLITGGSRTISAETFNPTSAASANFGKPYPVVFGDPGSNSRKVTPAYLVIDPAGPSRYALIAGHTVGATSVVVEDDQGNSATCTISYDRDALGQVYAYVDVDTTNFAASASEFYCAWTQDAADGQGALLKLGGAGTITGAGDLMLWLIGQTTIPVDTAAWQGLADTLNRYRVDGYINDEVTPLEFLTEELLDVLPIGLVGGTGGYRPVSLLPPDPDDCPRLTLGDGFRLASEFRVEGRIEETASRVTVKYAPDSADNYTAAAVIGEDDTAQGRFATDIYRKPVSRVVEFAFTGDQATAESIALETVMRDALLPESFDIEADLRFGWLRAGEWVVLDYDGVWSGMLVQIIERAAIEDDGTTVGWLFTMLWRESTQRDAVQA